MEAYAWPGNVRELQHVIERAVLLSRGTALRLDGALAEREETTRPTSNESTPGALQAVIPEIEWRRRERQNVRTALQLAKGRIYGPDGAAGIPGVKPITLYRGSTAWVCESRPNARAVAKAERSHGDGGPTKCCNQSATAELP